MASVQILAGDLSRVFTYTGKTIPGVSGNPQPGMIFEDGSGSQWKYVLNGHSAAQTAGNFGAYDYNGAGLTVGVGPLAAIAGNTMVVFQPTTATLNLMAGVWMGAAPLSTTTQTGAGWVQTKGPNASCLVTVTAIAIGDSIKLANASFAGAEDAATGTTPAFQSYAIALAASSAGGTALIRCQLVCAALAGSGAAF